MGKVEALGLMVAIAGALSTQSADGPPEADQIATANELIGMSRAEFESWCLDKGAESEVSLGSSDETRSTCAWIDPQSGDVWHNALHFDRHSQTPRQADAGLLNASAPTVLRLLHNEHGTTDGETAEGFPVWKVDVEGRQGLLAVAEYGEITLVRLRVPEGGVALSMR